MVLTVLAAVAAGCGLAEGCIAADAGKRSYWEQEHAGLAGMMATSSGRDRFGLDDRLETGSRSSADAARTRALRDEIKAAEDASTRELNTQGQAAENDWWNVRRAAKRLGRLALSFALLQAGALSALLAALPKRPRPRLRSGLGGTAWVLGALGLAAFAYAWLG